MTEQIVYHNESGGQDFNRVRIRVTDNSVKRAFRSESRFDLVFGEVERERVPFD